MTLRERCNMDTKTPWFSGASVCRAVPEPVRHFLLWEDLTMETRVAVMSIIVEDPNTVERLNAVLHEYSEYIIGRMGIPYRKRSISIISVALDAPQNTIAALAGKLGGLKGLHVKTAYSAVISSDE